MEWLIIGVIVIAAWIAHRLKFVRTRRDRDYRQPADAPSGTEIMAANLGWLQQRWAMAEAERESGGSGIFPKWFYDEPTEPQLRVLHEEGIKTRWTRLTKGQASDVIGLFHEPEDDELAVLRFFDMPTRNLNQSRARHETALLLADPDKAARYTARSATAMQKEYLRFHDIAIAPKLTAPEAEKLIAEHRAELDEAAEERWANYENIFDEMSDPDIREDYGIRKVSLSLYRSAIEDLRKAGRDISDLSTDEVVEKLIALKPDLERA